MNKKCEVCGKEFEPKTTTQKCCSPECSYKRERKKRAEYARKKHVKPKKCVVCGEIFYPTKEMRSYCSKECWNKKHARKESPEFCAYCGNPIIGRSAGAKYCSRLCCSRSKGGLRQKIAEKKHVSSISDTETQAREKGLSYGQYKAMEWLETHKYNILEGK